MQYIVGVETSIVNKEGHTIPITISHHVVEADTETDAKSLVVKWFCDGDINNVKCRENGNYGYTDRFRNVDYESRRAAIVSPADVFHFFSVTCGTENGIIIGRKKNVKTA
jgi:hypothetical protein